MKFLNDFLPIIFFFVIYKFYGIYAATAAAILISVLQVGYTWIRTRKFDNMQVITLAIITVLGGTTLLLHKAIFIKWKPTVINWLFGLAFLGSEFIGKHNITQKLLGAQIELPKAFWRKLNLSWVGFFILVGFVNLWVVYHFSTDFWVNFKLFGILGLTVFFVLAQAIWIARHAKQKVQR